MNENLTSVIITIITLLFSGGAWKFYEFRLKNKRAIKKEQFIYRDDLKNRVESLEIKKDDCLKKLMEISQEVSALRVKVEFIEKENEILKIKLQN